MAKQFEFDKAEAGEVPRQSYYGERSGVMENLYAGADEVVGGLAQVGADALAAVGADSYGKSLAGYAQSLRQSASRVKQDGILDSLAREAPKMVGYTNPVTAGAQVASTYGRAEGGQIDRGEDVNPLRNVGVAAAEGVGNALPFLKPVGMTTTLGRVGEESVKGAVSGMALQGGQNVERGRPVDENLGTATVLGGVGAPVASRAGQVAADMVNDGATALQRVAARFSGTQPPGSNAGLSREALRTNQAEGGDLLQAGARDIAEQDAAVARQFGQDAPTVPYNSADVAAAAGREQLATNEAARFNSLGQDATAFADYQASRANDLVDHIRQSGRQMEQEFGGGKLAEVVNQQKNNYWTIRQNMQNEAQQIAGELPFSPNGRIMLQQYGQQLRELGDMYRGSNNVTERRAGDIITNLSSQISSTKNNSLWSTLQTTDELLNNPKAFSTLEEAGVGREVRDIINELQGNAPQMINTATPDAMNAFNAFVQGKANVYKQMVEPLNDFLSTYKPNDASFFRKIGSKLASGTTTPKELQAFYAMPPEVFNIVAAGIAKEGAAGATGKRFVTFGRNVHDGMNLLNQQIKANIGQIEANSVLNNLAIKSGYRSQLDNAMDRVNGIMGQGANLKQTGAALQRGVSGSGTPEDTLQALPFVGKAIESMQGMLGMVRDNVMRKPTGAEVAARVDRTTQRQLLNTAQGDLDRAAKNIDVSDSLKAALARLNLLTALGAANNTDSAPSGEGRPTLAPAALTYQKRGDLPEAPPRAYNPGRGLPQLPPR